ncbi:hypothetical protein [Kluyvera ascorbata]|uniref:hypothetical protein n=1 Tax=Kluyvera ascorbata TaxID=51288 RepID=UPI0039F6C402
MSRIRISPEGTAKLIILNLDEYAKEKSKVITRYKISKETMRRISNRSNIHPGFIREVGNSLGELGWVLIESNDDHYCFLKQDAMNNWAKLTAKRIKGLRAQGEEAIADAYAISYPGDELDIDFEE